MSAHAIPASADPLGPTPPPPQNEVWSGADVSSNVWLLYTGATLAPFGGIHDNGLRFRAATGYGEYKYERAPNFEDDPANPRATKLHAETYFADLLVGYLQRFGELTAKGFVGFSVISHEISPVDEETVAIGAEMGLKGVVELWLNMGERGWGSLDLSWSAAHNTRTARFRTGYRVWPKLSLGLEGGLNIDSQGECRMKTAEASDCKLPDYEKTEPSDLMDYARGGAFVRYELDRGELSLSAGALGDSFAQDGSIEIEPYVTVNWLTQF